MFCQSRIRSRLEPPGYDISLELPVPSVTELVIKPGRELIHLVARKPRNGLFDLA
jgi:hypothetical protein